MSETITAKDVEHVGLAGNVLLCNRCGARQELTLPQPVDSVVALITAWQKTHKKCVGNRRAFRDATSIHDWPRSDDTGMSSMAIYRHIRGQSCDGRYPFDPDDFGRCHRLLMLDESWHRRIGEMARYGPEWEALASTWDELEALYIEELPNDTAPKLYARMKALLGGARKSEIPRTA